jgi:hypothetical protein
MNTMNTMNTIFNERKKSRRGGKTYGNVESRHGFGVLSAAAGGIVQHDFSILREKRKLSIQFGLVLIIPFHDLRNAALGF